MRVPSAVAALSLALVLAACAAPKKEAPSAATPPSAAAAPSADPAPPRLRLPDDARPTAYAAELTIDPTREQFSGRILIELDVKRPLSVLWLNADELSVHDVAAEEGEAHFHARVVTAPKDFVGVVFDRPLPPGHARVSLGYTGKLSSKDSAGASRQKEGDDWYVFTHFEPIDARRVFPCFDEPAYKVPWRLSLVVREGDRAFANTPEVATRALPKGMKRVEFAVSKPLPSYLVAFAVGPIEIVEAGASRKGAPIRILTPRGQAAQARWAKESTGQALAALEDWFGSPYPYEKLDMIAVPFFGGAMENPGLITFSSSLILRRPEEETIGSRRAYASVAIHELAHQWFGDLVTMAWWDDLWLNEAFATWMTPKIIETWQPGWGAAEERVRRAAGSMGADSLVTARRIRQPIVSNDDMKNAFDGITYGKGASVIHMFEQWIGPAAFQKGVRRYMERHAHGNATAADFLSAISDAATRDVSAPFSTFLDQPGVPLVTMEPVCEKGAARLKLAQERYLPVGSRGAEGGTPWRLPVCVRHAGGKACKLLEGPSGELPLGKSCPAWLLPNQDAAGYYRAGLPGAAFSTLLKDGGKRLSVPERVGVLDDLRALVRADKLPYAEALALMPRLAQDKSRHVVSATLGVTAGLVDGQLLPDELRPAYARFLGELYGKRARTLGWESHKGDDEDTRILRNDLVPLVASDGEDAVLVAQAKKLAAAWLADHKKVDPEAVGGLLYIAGRNGDRALFDQWLTAVRAERDLHNRRRLLGGLSSFRDPALVKEGLGLLFDDSLEIRETVALLWGATRNPETRRLAWDFVREHFDELVARLPRDFPANLPWVAVAQCDDAVSSEMEDFFRDRAPRFTGGPRQLAQALESLHLCAAFRSAQSASVTAYFRARK
jgi:alanyl aminopeptidase